MNKQLYSSIPIVLICEMVRFVDWNTAIFMYQTCKLINRFVSKNLRMIENPVELVKVNSEVHISRSVFRRKKRISTF